MSSRNSRKALDGRRTLAEHLAHLGVDGQVGVTLAGAQFGVFKRRVSKQRAVGQRLVLGGRQRTDRFGQQPEVMDVQGYLAGLRAEHHAAGLDKVADVEHLVEEVHSLLTKLVHTEEQLHFARNHPRCVRTRSCPWRAWRGCGRPSVTFTSGRFLLRGLELLRWPRRWCASSRRAWGKRPRPPRATLLFSANGFFRAMYIPSLIPSRPSPVLGEMERAEEQKSPARPAFQA